MPRPAPWELSCLGHYLPVTLDTAQSPEDSQCFDACKEFLLADQTFIPSWDFSKARVVGLWWDLTTSSIICSKLLIEKQRERDPRRGTIPIKLMPMRGEQDDAVNVARPDGNTGQMTSAAIVTNQKKMIKILEQLKASKANEEAEGFTWRKRRPGLLYHADTSVQSLEDTPQVYKLKQTHDVRVRPNIRKLMMENKLTPPNWTLTNIPTTLPAKKLRHISVFDFNLGGTTNDSEILISTVNGEAARAAIISETGSAKTRSDIVSLAKLIKLKPKLWEVYCLGISSDCCAGLQGREKQLVEDACRRYVGKLEDAQRLLVEDKQLRKTFLDLYQNSLFRVLNDSVSAQSPGDLFGQSQRLTQFLTSWLISELSIGYCKFKRGGCLLYL